MQAHKQTNKRTYVRWAEQLDAWQTSLQITCQTRIRPAIISILDKFEACVAGCVVVCEGVRTLCIIYPLSLLHCLAYWMGERARFILRQLQQFIQCIWCRFQENICKFASFVFTIIQIPLAFLVALILADICVNDHPFDTFSPRLESIHWLRRSYNEYYGEQNLLWALLSAIMPHGGLNQSVLAAAVACFPLILSLWNLSQKFGAPQAISLALGLYTLCCGVYPGLWRLYNEAYNHAPLSLKDPELATFWSGLFVCIATTAIFASLVALRVFVIRLNSKPQVEAGQPDASIIIGSEHTAADDVVQQQTESSRMTATVAEDSEANEVEETLSAQSATSPEPTSAPRPPQPLPEPQHICPQPTYPVYISISITSTAQRRPSLPRAAGTITPSRSFSVPTSPSDQQESPLPAVEIESGSPRAINEKPKLALKSALKTVRSLTPPGAPKVVHFESPSSASLPFLEAAMQWSPVVVLQAPPNAPQDVTNLLRNATDEVNSLKQNTLAVLLHNPTLNTYPDWHASLSTMARQILALGTSLREMNRWANISFQDRTRSQDLLEQLETLKSNSHQRFVAVYSTLERESLAAAQNVPQQHVEKKHEHRHARLNPANGAKPNHNEKPESPAVQKNPESPVVQETPDNVHDDDDEVFDAPEEASKPYIFDKTPQENQEKPTHSNRSRFAPDADTARESAEDQPQEKRDNNQHDAEQHAKQRETKQKKHHDSHNNKSGNKEVNKGGQGKNQGGDSGNKGQSPRARRPKH